MYAYISKQACKTKRVWGVPLESFWKLDALRYCFWGHFWTKASSSRSSYYFIQFLAVLPGYMHLLSQLASNFHEIRLAEQKVG